ncbi:MAG: recombinase family protein [Armatimonadetes bacterium]|nr:recombinase family protein [Armatimonadota bacterium]
MARPRGTKVSKEQQARLATGAGKLIGYIRVSTTQQGTNGHSLDGQRTRLQEAAVREGFVLVDVVAEVESGAKERDGLAEVQARVLAGEAQGVIFPKVDRLGRSMVHLLKVVDWAVKNRIDLLSADEGWQVRDGKKIDKMLPFRLAMAEVELERIRERTRDGLKAAKQKGVRLGRPAENVGDLAKRATKLRKQGKTWQEIADLFNAEGLRTARGAEFRTTTIARMIDRTDPTANPEGGYRGNALAAVA